MDAFVLSNIGDLVTLAPPAQAGRLTGLTAADLGRPGGPAWLAVRAGRTCAYGTGQPSAAYADWPQHNAHGGLVMPGLVDSHAHPIFAGSRADELSLRLSEASYQEIAASGGGIRSTMLKTRAASDTELLDLLERRLSRFLNLGITTLEAKSGYGLSVAAELRLLRVLAKAQARARQKLVVTCLALHAASPEATSLAAYIDQCAGELLPTVQAEGLATFVDAFIETGYFSVRDVEPYARRARELGLGIRLHADEFTDAGGAAAAADWQAASADHLQFASPAAAAKMAAAGVVATILPGTSLYTRIPFTDARRFADAGVPVAVATDFNPGSSLVDNLAMLATVAAVQCGLRPPEAVASVTLVAAASLGLGQSKGSLAAGYDADFLVYDLPSIEEWLADFGRTPPREVWIRGVKARGTARDAGE